jgi:hypothetical protein
LEVEEEEEEGKVVDNTPSGVRFRILRARIAESCAEGMVVVSSGLLKMA